MNIVLSPQPTKRAWWRYPLLVLVLVLIAVPVWRVWADEGGGHPPMLSSVRTVGALGGDETGVCTSRSTDDGCYTVTFCPSAGR